MSRVFDEKRKDAQTMRAVGVRTYFADFSGIEDTRQKEIKNTTISYVTDGAAMMQQASAERSATLLTLSAMHWLIEDKQKGVDILDDAISVRNEIRKTEPSRPTDSEEIGIWEMYMIKAARLQDLERKPEAVQSYEEAQNLCREDPKYARYWGWILEHMLIILDEMREDSRIMAAFKSGTDKERHTWFNLNLQYWVRFVSNGANVSRC